MIPMSVVAVVVEVVARSRVKSRQKDKHANHQFDRLRLAAKGLSELTEKTFRHYRNVVHPFLYWIAVDQHRTSDVTKGNVSLPSVYRLWIHSKGVMMWWMASEIKIRLVESPHSQWIKSWVYSYSKTVQLVIGSTGCSRLPLFDWLNA
jgi:hypothetical protein